MKFVLALLLLLAGCTTLSKKVSPGADRSSFFPVGNYTHQIEISTKEGKSYSFKGIVVISKSALVVVGLSPFQTTLFKITENRATGAIESEFFQADLEKHKESVLDFYSILSIFLTLPRNGQDSRSRIYTRDDAGRPREVGIFNKKGHEIRLQFLHYDENGVLDDAKMQHPKFEVRVRIVSYEI